MSLAEHHFRPPGGVWTDENYPAHRDAIKAAAKNLDGYTRLYTRRGTVAHLAPSYRGGATVFGALCPVIPQWPGEWLGTGSQAEYEMAAELPTCKRCYEAFTASVRCGNPECPCQIPLREVTA